MRRIKLSGRERAVMKALGFAEAILGEQIGERAFAIKLLRQPGEDVFARVIGTTYIIERSPEFLRSFKS